MDVGQEAWEADLATGVVSAARTPLPNGITWVSLNESQKNEYSRTTIRDNGGVVCTALFLRMLVDEYLLWRLAIIKQMGGEGEYVTGDCLLCATPGKSDRVDEATLLWVVPEKIQRTCLYVAGTRENTQLDGWN